MPLKRSIILIIDSDLGSVFWLGQLLDATGYESLPAKSLWDAKLLLAELKVTIDLLIVSASIPGVAAFTESLRSSQGRLKTIGLLGDDEEMPEVEPHMDAWLQKPVLTDGVSKLGYLELVNSLLGPNAGVKPAFPVAALSF